MKIGKIVKVKIPYKLGEKRNGKKYKYKKGKIIALYPNFALIEFKTKSKETYRECYKIEELIV